MESWLRRGTGFLVGNVLWDMLKGVVPLIVAWVSARLAAAGGLAPWQVLAVALLSFLVVVWSWNGVLYLSNIRRRRRRRFRNKTVRLADLIAPDASSAPILDGYVFEDCVIRGPTVLMVLPGPPNLKITGQVRFDAPLDTAIIALSASTTSVGGVIGIRGVEFIRPDFRLVSFCAEEQRAKDLRTFFSEAMRTGRPMELRHGEPRDHLTSPSYD
jgi:hypothetical protein